MSIDYVVAGAGSAGCAVAYELVTAGHSVLLLEAGKSDRSLSIKMPAAILRAIAKYDWGYRSAPDGTRNHKSEPWHRGRVVGGSSSINGMIYVRGSAGDYDRWCAMGNPGWDSANVMRLFKYLERCDSSIEDCAGVRGRDGKLRIRMVKYCHPLTDAFIEAATSVGYEFNADYNGTSQVGVGYSQFTQHAGRRWSAADAFLHPVLGSKNLKLVTGAHIHRLMIATDRTVRGLVYERGEQLHELSAKNVILCGGALNTPKILMHSGIGDASELAQHGIASVLDRKAVGSNLMEHATVRLVYRMTVPTYNPNGLAQRTRLLTKYILKGQGLLATPFEAMAFIRSSAESEPDLQLHFALIGMSSQDGSVSSSPCVMISVKKNHPASSGTIKLAAADPRLPPVITPRLLKDQRDVDSLVRGITAVRKIMLAPPIARFVSGEMSPGPACDSHESLADFVRNSAYVASHPIGTCRMGSDEESVVTPELKVRGVTGLWIADASIMPRHISGNTNAACMMIGAKLGRQLSSR